MANLRANKIVGIGSTDAGVTFNGPISLNTQGYMYFPTGNTTDRGRGRALIAGGSTPSVTTNIDFLNPITGFDCSLVFLCFFLGCLSLCFSRLCLLTVL